MSWYSSPQNSDKLNQAIKEVLKKDPLCRYLLDFYKLPESDIDEHLTFHVKKMKGKYSEANGNVINLNPKILGPDFFENNFHFVVHEFFHWIKRRIERRFYFNDDEEVQSFVLAMVWELRKGRSHEDIHKKIYPLIGPHFDNEHEAEVVFQRMFGEARKIESKVR